MSNLPEPFLGRIFVEVIKETAEDYLNQKLRSESKVSEEFLNKLEIVRGETKYDERGQKVFEKAGLGSVPISKGKIIKMAEDAFGTYFMERYGAMEKTPQVGDTVHFIPCQSHKFDVENKYHLINDSDIVAYERG